MINKKILSVVIIAVLIGGGVAIGLSIAFWPREVEEGNLFLLPPGGEQVPENAFISVWNTSKPGLSNDDEVNLPLEEIGEYNFTVNWGDGIKHTITKWNQSEVNHTYTSERVYTIIITGKIIGWRFNNRGDKDKLLEIKQWGDLRLGNSGDYFEGCSNLKITATDILNLTRITTLSRAFRDCSTLDTVPSMNNWDVSSVTDMHSMFRGADNFNQAIGDWNVSSVTDMTWMFYGATSFNQAIGDWTVSSVYDMELMFWNATSFNQAIGDWDVSSVHYMDSMFYDAAAFNQSIGDWDVSSVIDMNWTFYGATNFNQNLSSWVVSNVGDMNGMFNGSALSTENYDSLLIGWSNLTSLQSHVTLGVGDVQYSSEAQDAHDYLTGITYNWIIKDGGLSA